MAKAVGTLTCNAFGITTACFEWAHLASWQWLVDLSENVGEQAICPVPGVCVQYSIQLCNAQCLHAPHASCQTCWP